MPKPWLVKARLAENRRRAVSILRVIGVHDRRNNEAGRVVQDVALTAFDPLAPVITGYAAAFCGFTG